MSIEQKQQFLRQNVMEVGYEPTDFESYWQSLELDFESITLRELETIVGQFKKLYQLKKKNQDQDFSDFQSADPEMMKIDWGFLEIKNKQEINSKVQISSIPIPTHPENLTELKKVEQQKPKPNSKTKPEIDFLDMNSSKQSQNSGISPQKVNRSRQGLPDNSISIRQVYKQSTSKTHKCLKLQPNIIDHHNNVEIYLQRVNEDSDQVGEDGSIREKGFITKLWEGAKTTIGLNQVPVMVKTTGRNKSKAIGVSWKVLRKRNDFEWLHKMLIKFYPGTVVPPLPGIPRFEEKVFGYIKKCQAYLMDTYRCRQLRNSIYFQTFLSYGNRGDFQSFIKNSQSLAQPGNLSHILNMKGQVDLYYGEKIAGFAQNLNGYLSSESSHLKAVKSITNQIIGEYENLSLNFQQLADVFGEMTQETDTFSLAMQGSEEQQGFNLLTQTYAQIASLMSKHSEFCVEEKASIQAFMYSHFSYEKDRLQNIQNLIQKRSTFADALQKLQKSQQQKPEKQQNKLSMFGLSKLTNLFTNKTESLQIPSPNLQILKKQVGFYNSQVLKQTSRCIDVTIQSYVNHFSNYGHSRVDNVDSVQQVWSKVMVQFSRIRVG